MEVETKLLIIAPNPETFLRQMANTSTILNYQLRKKGRRKIRDIYLDTKSGDLKTGRLALRLRKMNNNYLLTLKGKTVIYDWGGVKRLEIELPWSLKSVKQMNRILTENQIPFIFSENLYRTLNPVNYLHQLTDIEIIQDRETRRLIRYITQKEHPEKILAEMALDIVSYHLQNLLIHQAEIELEAKSSAGIKAIQHIHTFLLQKYPDALRSWTLSKLTTGLLLEKMSQTESLSSFLNDQNFLLPEMYERMLKNLNTLYLE